MGCGASEPIRQSLYNRKSDILIEDKEEVADCLENSPLIASYLKSNQVKTHKQFLRLAGFFKTLHCHRGDVLCEVGDDSRYLFVLKTGSVREVQKNEAMTDKVVGYHHPTVFGETDFLDHRQCIHGYCMEAAGVVHYIEHDKFVEVINTLALRNTIADTPLFADTPITELRNLSRVVTKKKYMTDTYIVRKNARADTFYIIAHGQVSVLPDYSDCELSLGFQDSDATKNRMKHDQILGLDTYFGEDCLILNQPYPVSILALTDVEMFEIKKEHFETCMPTVFKLLEERVLREEKRKMSRSFSSSRKYSSASSQATVQSIGSGVWLW